MLTQGVTGAIVLFMRHLAMALLLLPTAATADEVFLKGGGRLVGEVVEETPTRVVLEIGAGRVTVPRSHVVRMTSSRSALEAFRDRAAALPRNDADGWFDLGLFARSAELPSQARQAFEYVLRLDPTHAGAHQELGHRMVDGRWMTEDESMLARGFVRFEGRWMAPPERDALLEERRAMAIESQARAESQARVREAEARARQAEADARAAEANARAAENIPSSDGLPVYPPYGGVLGGYGGYVGGGYGAGGGYVGVGGYVGGGYLGGGYGGGLYPPVDPGYGVVPPPVVVVAPPPRPSHGSGHGGRSGRASTAHAGVGPKR
jgi:hypothetical protein